MKQPIRVRYRLPDGREVTKAEHAAWQRSRLPKPPTEAELRSAIERNAAELADIKRRVAAKPAPSKSAGLTKQQLADIDRVSGLAPKPAEGAHTVGVRQVLGPKPVASTKLTSERKREIDAASFGERNTGRVTMQGTRQVLGGFEVAK